MSLHDDPERLRRRLSESALLGGVAAGDCDRLVAIARTRRLRPGEALFTLGDEASALAVVLEGAVDLTFPLAAGCRDSVCVESVAAGGALGWSALVEPHRYTLTATASMASEVALLDRAALAVVFRDRPETGLEVMTRVAELVAIRLLTVQALWARGLIREAARASQAGSRPPSWSRSGDAVPPDEEGRRES